eukprot:6490677-Amphidinium_carterae.8
MELGVGTMGVAIGETRWALDIIPQKLSSANPEGASAQGDLGAFQAIHLGRSCPTRSNCPLVSTCCLERTCVKEAHMWIASTVNCFQELLFKICLLIGIGKKCGFMHDHGQCGGFGDVLVTRLRTSQPP